jgi:hypothetical protein
MGKYHNLVGQKRGRLTVIRDVGRDKWGNVIWECKCNCGNLKTVSAFELSPNKKRGTRSCGCLHKEKVGEVTGIDLTGQRFTRLLVIRKVEGNWKHWYWLCKCDCGKEIIVSGQELRSKHTKSCKCWQKDKAREHMKKLALTQKGSGHPMWRGGLNKPYPEVFTPDFRTKLRKRDNYTCQICGLFKFGLDVHHIDKNKQNCIDRNLITLCRMYHRNVHEGNIPLQEILESAGW